MLNLYRMTSILLSDSEMMFLYHELRMITGQTGGSRGT